MGQLFDHISRILAKPLPRSTAIRLILGALVAFVMAPFGWGDGRRRQWPCPPGQEWTGTQCKKVESSPDRPDDDDDDDDRRRHIFRSIFNWAGRFS